MPTPSVPTPSVPTPRIIWPQSLIMVRHGESAGNVARGAALAAGLPSIDIDVRDVDVPLSALGERQAVALGAWFASLDPGDQPNVVLSSPYVRARRTAEIIAEHGCFRLVNGQREIIVDERLREKEFGVLDRLTAVGIVQQHPEQAELRQRLGKFYFRPPGGESWCDVILRLRSAFEMICREYRGERVLLVCHSVVVLCLRYIIEQMTEEEILAIDRAEEVANCSVTSYSVDDTQGRHGKLVLRVCNFVAPLEEHGTAVTSMPDAPAVR